MTARVVSAAIRRGIVARILAGKLTAAQAAKQYGQKPATVRGWVHEDKEEVLSKMKPTTTPPTTHPATTEPNPVVVPPGKAPGDGTAARDEDAVARARAAANLPPLEGGASHHVVATVDEAALEAADAEDRKLVLTTYTEGKKAIVEILARRTGLDPAHELVKAAAVPSELSKIVLSTNAGLIAPIIRGKLVGWPAVAGVLIFEVALTFMTIRDVAIALGKIKPPGEPPAPQPPPRP